MISKHQKHAQQIVQKLQEAGYTALFAGGWVRDFILGKPSQDIDIATNAHPEEVMKLFKKTVAVGAQFGVVRVRIDQHEYEVATFRSDEQYVDGRRPSHIRLLSSPEEDAARRDFTINGMFYDPIAKELYDYVGGEKDLKQKTIRTIGEPLNRFQEDRLRIIRAIRFKNTFHFTIDPKTWHAICTESCHVPQAVSPERIWQELHKMLTKKILFSSLVDLHECGLLLHLFKELKTCSTKEIKRRLQHIKKYTGKSLAAALCLLIDDTKELCQTYHLSKNEEHICQTFTMIKTLTPSDEAYVHLYARSGISTCLLAFSCLKKDPQTFLKRHRERQEELDFWIEQVRSRSFLISGKELMKMGFKPGKKLGQALHKAFSFSLHHRIKDKKQLKDLLHAQKDL